MIYSDVCAAVSDAVRLLLLGNRVCYRKCVDDVWNSVLGFHGRNVRNQAGEDFLAFCEIISCPS